MKLTATATFVLFAASSLAAQQTPAPTPIPATEEVQNYALEANSFIESAFARAAPT